MKKSKRLILALGAGISIPLVAIALWVSQNHGTRRKVSQIDAAGSVAVSRPVQPPAGVSTPPDKVISRPLPVALTSATHQWAEGDATSPAVIEKIAHNPDEFIRMVEENERIKRRQLVYRQDTAAAVVQRARATGEPVRKLTLPGLDGQEIDVEVTRADLAFSGLSGTFIGRLPGKLQSIVTLSFKNNREAFSVASPEDGLYLEAEPREPGQVVVKAIDPNTYATGHCGTDEYAQEQEKQRKSQGR
ncbi:MAG: hypothetical protein ABIS50_06395 [Luteolibacter sp.]|uniref:hypothetical protein n=1 Tax=Luteolibacter sp. TaxID=1962973 RepID=UPI003265C03E